MDYLKEILTDYLKEILAIVGEESTGIPRKYIDWEAFSRLEKLYNSDPREFRDAVVRFSYVVLRWLDEPVAETLERIREEDILLDVLSDVLWFVDTKSIKDDAIAQALKMLERNREVLSCRNLVVVIRAYLYPPYY